MKVRMFFGLLTFLSILQTAGAANVQDIETLTVIKNVFKDRNLDFDSKSSLGWVRVLTSPDKRKEYGLGDLEESQILYITAQLKLASKIKNEIFEGKLK